MATPAQLVRAVSEVLGAQETSVTTHDRNLAKAGLRRVGGRGRGAARMTQGDAANLLIAVVGSLNVMESAVIVNRYAPLPAGHIRRSARLPTQISQLGSAHSFHDGLAAVLLLAMSGGDLVQGPGEELVVHIHWPVASASIALLTEVGDTWGVQYGEKYLQISHEAGDLSQTRSFTHRTLLRVGELLRS